MRKIKKYRKQVKKEREKYNGFTYCVVMFFACIFDMLRFLFRFLFKTSVFLILLMLFTGFIVCIKIRPTLREWYDEASLKVIESTESTFNIPESSIVLDDNGEVIAILRDGAYSEYIEYEDIPSEVINAFIAIEDRSYWENTGYDPKGIARVGINFITSKGEEVAGASTITQQLARNIFLSHERSITRKVKEILIATELTKKYGKEAIMEFYCNDICFSNGVYGIASASRAYFNKEVNELSLKEVAYLCAIPNSPEYYNPLKFPNRPVKRAEKILGDMLECGFINRTDYESAMRETVILETPSYFMEDYATSYAVDCAVYELLKNDGFKFKYKFKSDEDYQAYHKKFNEAYEKARKELYNGGYIIKTSLNIDLCHQMQDVINTDLSFDEGIDETTGFYELQSAVTCIDNDTGKVVAIVGGRNDSYKTEQLSLNRAYQSYRQPGSSIKPLIVYAPAIERLGYHADTIVENISVSEAKVKGVDVQSLEGEEMRLRDAVTSSKNGVAWQTFDKLGAKVGLSYLEKMQFSNLHPNDYFNASSLGGFTYGVTTTEMASAYRALAKNGQFVKPTCIVSITDREGNEVFKEHEFFGVYKSWSADAMSEILEGVVSGGTAYRMQWWKSTKVKAFAKTGTTDNSKDGWLCGATPYYSIAVWVGYDTPKTLNGLMGGTYPAQIWKDCMLLALGEVEEGSFEKTSSYYEFLDNIVIEEIEEEVPEVVISEENDKAIGEKVQSIIDGMYRKDRNLSGYPIILKTAYDEGMSLLNGIGNPDYKNSMQQKLDWTYKALLREAGY